ncbi:hypothetical protein EAM_1069 [Erwinia amylovora ATCC 49946]|nr:hypothetical protein AD997_05475 [Erwinia amylovora]RUT17833.1 hypothetical protein BEI72_05735 [Erwinia amylovora]CBJ45744.1 hypothetical protein EAM_1069 [Erwinia amylovora ATCC 49946]
MLFLLLLKAGAWKLFHIFLFLFQSGIVATRGETIRHSPVFPGRTIMKVFPISVSINNVLRMALHEKIIVP